jgi:hypothetical protein
MLPAPFGVPIHEYVFVLLFLSLMPELLGLCRRECSFIFCVLWMPIRYDQHERRKHVALLAAYAHPVWALYFYQDYRKMTTSGIEDEGSPRDALIIQGLYQTLVCDHFLDSQTDSRQDVRYVNFRSEVRDQTKHVLWGYRKRTRPFDWLLTIIH